MRVINRNWMDFPGGLRSARMARGLTQSGLAQLMGVDQATVSRWERGTQVPEPELQIQLRDYLFRGRAVQDAMICHFIRTSLGLRCLISSDGIILVASQACGGANTEGRSIFDFGASKLQEAWSMTREAGAFRGGLASARFATDMFCKDGHTTYIDCVCYPVPMTDGTPTLLADMVMIDKDRYAEVRAQGIVITSLDSILATP